MISYYKRWNLWSFREGGKVCWPIISFLWRGDSKVIYLRWFWVKLTIVGTGWGKVPFKRFVRQGHIVPWWLGLAYKQYDRDSAVCFPVPFNWVVAVVRTLWYRLKFPPDRFTTDWERYKHYHMMLNQAFDLIEHAFDTDWAKVRPQLAWRNSARKWRRMFRDH